MKEKMKKHFENNKKIYLAIVATAVTTAIVTYSFVTRDGLDIKNSFNTKTILKDSTIKITNYLSPRDNPAYVIFDPESKRSWVSQNEFAKEVGTNASHVSRYFNGHQDDILGMKPIRLGHSMIPNQELITSAV